MPFRAAGSGGSKLKKDLVASIFMAVALPAVTLYSPYELTRIIKHYLEVLNISSPLRFYWELVAIWLSWLVSVAVVELWVWREFLRGKKGLK